ncbi:hypothetical protein NKH73_03400 [Mesorhizobium sp. M0938]|uniref:hypothetical protein n=1 Tax=unclassified Mesorhizobium TaxID=325217 RepID=UPI003338C5F1
MGIGRSQSAQAPVSNKVQFSFGIAMTIRIATLVKCFAIAFALFLANQAIASANYDKCYRKIEAKYGEYTDITWMQKVWKCTEEADQADADAMRDSSSKSAKPSKKSNDDGRAPYTDVKCVNIKPSKNRGTVDWDSVTITNTCDIPVQVIACYYDKGKESKCENTKGGGWGTTSTIKPRGSTRSVSTSSKPDWSVRYYVCDMTGVKKHSRLCLLPRS